MPKAKTQEKFIEELEEIYGKTNYDFSSIQYITNKTKVVITCNIHNITFWKFPKDILKGSGCRTCVYERNIRINCERKTKEFVEKSRKIHGNKYIYDKVQYRNRINKIIIICKEHGEFLQSPGTHLSGSGCHDCGLFSINKKKLNNTILDQKTIKLKQKLVKLFNNKYILDQTIYTGANTHVTLTCPIDNHGDFTRRLHYLLKGNGCHKCLDVYYTEQFRIKQFEIFKTKANVIHSNKYDYSKANYITGYDKIIIICPKHGEFKQQPSSHLNGCGCSRCFNKSEGKVYNWLVKKFPNLTIIHQYKPDWLKPYSFDFFIKELNLIIELDGIQHFEQFRNWKSPELHQRNDCIKMKLAVKNNLSVMRIPRSYIFYRAKMLTDKLEKIKKHIKKRTKPRYIIFKKSMYSNLISLYKNNNLRSLKSF